MRGILGGLCIVVVGLQILVGVPFAVCLAFFASVQSGGLPSITVEVQGGPRMAATIPPCSYAQPMPPTMSEVVPQALPPNKIPVSVAANDNPILLSRLEQGSPLAGTLLADQAGLEEEQQLFLTALEKAAAEAEAKCQPACTTEEFPAACFPTVAEDQPGCSTGQLLGHLYVMAELDEQEGNFERADQWRALARGLRGDANSHASP